MAPLGVLVYYQVFFFQLFQKSFEVNPLSCSGAARTPGGGCGSRSGGRFGLERNAGILVFVLDVFAWGSGAFFLFIFLTPLF